VAAAARRGPRQRVLAVASGGVTGGGPAGGCATIGGPGDVAGDVATAARCGASQPVLAVGNMALELNYNSL